MDLELRHYRLFAAVADTGSFTRAARELGTSQPAVSRGVAAIERRLGVLLIARTSRRFTLTEAGRTLLQEAKLLLDAAAAAESRTRRAARQRRLVLGVKADSAGEFLAELLDRCADAPLHLDVDLDFRETHELAAAVRRGHTDACLVAWPVTEAALACELLWSEPRVAVVRTGHPLTSAAQVTVQDFHGEPVARWPALPRALDLFYQGVDGDEPDTRRAEGPAVSGLADALRLVELGRAVTFLPASVAVRFARSGLAMLAVEGLSPSRMFVTWRERTTNPDLDRLVELCHHVAQRGAGTAPAP